MNPTWFTIAQLVLALSNGLVQALTKSGAPQQVIDDAQAGAEALAKVVGSEVTKGQLSELEFTPMW